MRSTLALFLVLLATPALAQTRDFWVTSTADSGPGTLRQAILDINEQCQSEPCRAAIDITQKIGGDFFHTITLLSPLPALNVPHSAIDGSTEDPSNTLGPSVALDGSLLQTGNGITVASGTCDIKSIAIGNFPWNGILATGDARVNVDRAYIGMNALGLALAPNGARGIASDRVAGTITNCLIAANVRSGLFFAGPNGGGLEIRNNRIGIPGPRYGVPNGASGIFIGAYQRDDEGSLARIGGNLIANNAHFGIALATAGLAIVEANSIYQNALSGIDIGLDGPSGATPVITSATTAKNGVTTISGFVEAAEVSSVDLYANEGEQFLGTAMVENGAFTFTINRDLRGKYVNGVAQSAQGTSEFGPATLVISN